MGIVTKGQIEKCREMLRDVEHYISPLVLGACEKLKEKSISFIKVRPGSLKRADICYYGFDVEEYVKVNFSITYQIHGNPTGLAEGFAVTFMIDICADIEDLVYHYDDILDIKDNNQEKAKTISLRPIDDITKEYLCEQAVRDAPIVKEYFAELMRIVEKADEYLKKYYKKKSIYVGSHYKDISVYRNGVYGQPENYKEYFMDMLLLAKTKWNMGHTVEKITDMAKQRGVEISLTIDEIKKHIEFKNKHGYQWIGPFCKVLDTNLIEAFGYSKNASHLLLVEDFENALYPDRPKKMTYDDGSYYEGKMKDGLRHGQGTYYWKNGNKYVGEWKNGKREGQGTYYWKDGSKYVGEWKNSEKHGKGVIYYKDGATKKVVYNNGTLVSTLPNNIREKYDDGSYYEGEMKNGLRHGQGTYYWKNGNKYVGEWQNGKREGQGTYYWKNGSKYVGEWKNSERHGKGVIYYKNGTKENVVFDNGKCVKKNS